jgi:accessory gene regulator protein AgrB
MIELRNRLSNKIGFFLGKYHEDENAAITITYEMNIFFRTITWLSILFTIGHFLEIKLSIFIFLITFASIRRSFGGFHVKNEYVCMLLISTAIPISLLYMATKIKINTLEIVITYVFGYLIAQKIGVVDNPKKVLKPERKAKFKKQGFITLVIINAIHAYYIFTCKTNISNAITIGVIVAFTNVLAQKFKKN